MRSNEIEDVVLTDVYEIRIVDKEIEGYRTKTRLTPVKVFVNDEEMLDYGVTYEEAGTCTIIFDRALMPGEIIKVMFQTPLTKVVSKNPYSKNSIYTLFGSDVRFMLNQKYEFFIKGSEDYESTFQSKYDPYYCTVKRIRTDTGSLFDNVKDEVIARVIYDNSKLVIDKLGGIEEVDFEEGIPLYVKNFVRYKTDIDLCYAVYLSKTGKLGAFKKTLGDLDVSNEVKLPALDEMLSRFRELLKPNESALQGEDANISSGFVKASSTEYTVTSRGVF